MTRFFYHTLETFCSVLHGWSYPLVCPLASDGKAAESEERPAFVMLAVAELTPLPHWGASFYGSNWCRKKKTDGAFSPNSAIEKAKWVGGIHRPGAWDPLDILQGFSLSFTNLQISSCGQSSLKPALNSRKRTQTSFADCRDFTDSEPGK